MINKILKDIDNEESYYVGTNGCLYQDLDKEELLAIKQEIERLNNIINELEKWLVKEKDRKEEIAIAQGVFIDKDLSERLDHQIGIIGYVLAKLQELKGSDKE